MATVSRTQVPAVTIEQKPNLNNTIYQEQPHIPIKSSNKLKKKKKATTERYNTNDMRLNQMNRCIVINVMVTPTVFFFFFVVPSHQILYDICFVVFQNICPISRRTLLLLLLMHMCDIRVLNCHRYDCVSAFLLKNPQNFTMGRIHILNILLYFLSLR